MAHQHKCHVKDLIKRELNFIVSIDRKRCEGCINGKTHRFKFVKKDRTEKPG